MPLRPIWLSEELDNFVQRVAMVNKCRFNDAFRSVLCCGQRNWKNGEPVVKLNAKEGV